MSNFKFESGANVTNETSGEDGKVIARAEYESAENNYLIRYKAADGRAVEAWWTERALA